MNSASPPLTPTPITMRGPSLTFARIIWIVLAVTCLGLFAMSLPYRYAELTENMNDFGAVLAQANIPQQPLVIYYLTIDILAVVIFSAIAVFIFARKSTDRMSLIVSFSLLMSGYAFAFPLNTLYLARPELYPIINVTRGLGYTLFTLMFFIFPDGRFVPSWTKIALGVYVLWTAGWVIFPQAGFAPGGEVNPAGFMVAIFWLLLGVAVQVYRYRKISTPQQKQQTKWVIFGFAAPALAFISVVIPLIVIPVLSTTSLETVIYYTLAVPVLYLMPVMMPISIMVSILRYRLWDIDFVINRSIVYGALTVSLVLTFLIGFAILSTAFDRLLGGDQTRLAGLVATGVVIALFQPVRGWLYRLVDKRLYGIEVNYQQMVRRTPTTTTLPGGKLHAFERYTDLSLIGSGGMGEVYRATHPDLNRVDAIKLLPRALWEDEALQSRFRREAQAIARLKHPNIVQLHDFGEADGFPYMVIEYIEGLNLSEVLRQRGKLLFEETAIYLTNIASALDYAHSLGIIHRDVKAANVMLRPKGSAGYEAVLIDFGLARVLDATQMTATGLLGTLDYMAPEQIQGADVSGSADVYALGVLAYQIVTGELPFKHTNPGALLLAHLQQPAPDPAAVVPTLPYSVSLAIRRALAKRPEERYPTACAFAEEFSEAAD